MTKVITASEYRKSLKPGKSKYRNINFVLYDKDRNEDTKQVFDSKREMRRWGDLCSLQRQGIIYDLERQVKYELIPAHYAIVDGKRKCIERACSYYADFAYTDSNGTRIVEDSKGVRTTDFIIKKKLMLHVHGIQIKEV